ncbi:MAG TPA: hypothetical protein VHD83_23140 [Puia sp.]|nr:hypothetical protein [Puia sp.]
MRKLIITLALLIITAVTIHVEAQCSICTRTAQQLGERPAKALNRGIIYLAFAPLTILGVVGYRWWKSQSAEEHGSSLDNR